MPEIWLEIDTERAREDYLIDGDELLFRRTMRSLGYDDHEIDAEIAAMADDLPETFEPVEEHRADS